MTEAVFASRTGRWHPSFPPAGGLFRTRLRLVSSTSLVRCRYYQGSSRKRNGFAAAIDARICLWRGAADIPWVAGSQCSVPTRVAAGTMAPKGSVINPAICSRLRETRGRDQGTNCECGEKRRHLLPHGQILRAPDLQCQTTEGGSERQVGAQGLPVRVHLTPSQSMCYK